MALGRSPSEKASRACTCLLSLSVSSPLSSASLTALMCTETEREEGKREGLDVSGQEDTHLVDCWLDGNERAANIPAQTLDYTDSGIDGRLFTRRQCASTRLGSSSTALLASGRGNSLKLTAATSSLSNTSNAL